MAPQTNSDYDEAVGTASAYEEIVGGDFPRTFKPGPAADEDGDLEGIFISTETKPIKGKDRVIHTFRLLDGETVTVWGAAILDSRLKDVPSGKQVKVVKTGQKLTSQSGNQPWEYRLYVAKNALGS